MTTTTKQTRPYNDHPPYQRESDTSRQAAEGVAGKAPTLREQALALFGLWGKGAGLTDHQLANLLHVPLQTAVPRRRELVLRGLVCDSGRRRRTPSGRTATVWVRTGDGEQMELL